MNWSGDMEYHFAILGCGGGVSLKGIHEERLEFQDVLRSLFEFLAEIIPKVGH